MVARKRQRHEQRKQQLSGAPALEQVDLCPTLAPFASLFEDVTAECGMSQASLDELSVQGPPAEEASSPIGSSLRAIKARRCFGLASVSAVEESTPFASLEVANASPLRCPASWGSPGLSQAQLDAMCGGDDDENVADDIFSDEVDNSCPRMPRQVSPVAPGCPSPPKCRSPAPAVSPCSSPPMRRRRASKKADAENAGYGGKITPAVSPSKGMDASPGNRDMLLSPQRRSPCLTALSPTRLN